MAEFIEVHVGEDEPILINVASIKAVICEDGATKVWGQDDLAWKVQESYDEVTEKIMMASGWGDVRGEVIAEGLMMSDAVQCLWSCMAAEDREAVRETYPDIAMVADKGFQSADGIQDDATREATEEETDGN